MDKDIVPELLELINSEFDSKVLNSDAVKQAVKKLRDKQASYKDANDFAIEVGDILADVFKDKISADILPDGRMYYNIADRIMNETLGKNHELIAGYTQDVQSVLNQQAKIGIKAQKADLNQGRIDGMVERLAKEEDYNKIKWMLDEPVKNFSQSIVDDTVKANADFHDKSGLAPKIVRRSTGTCCAWCDKVVGVYDYRDAPKDIYRRHRFCRCTVEYYPGDGKRQNAHTKKWIDSEKDAKIEVRKLIARDEQSSEAKKARKLIRLAKEQEEKVTKDLIAISGKAGSEMTGLDYRLKTIDSLTRKIKKEPNAKMRDVLRYTNISNADNQVENYFKMVGQLQEKGYTISTVKNYWENTNNPYNGININLLTPSKYEFELQFHTPESFELKNGKLHELYEKQRLIKDKRSDEYIKLNDEMFRLSNSLKVPEKIKEVK